MKIQLIRHAALWVEYAGTTFLIDPMLSPQGVNPPIANSDNSRNNPLCPLPGPVGQWLSPDAVIVTHLHQDHWDAAAASLLPRTLPVFCQEGDEGKLAAQGFTNAVAVSDAHQFQDITLIRTSGKHGTGITGQLMGKVSGFIFRAKGEPVLYVAGDTIWCGEVRQELDNWHPDHVVVNAGGARFKIGAPITMDAADVVELCRYSPWAQITAVHMEAINHCGVTRGLLRQALEQEGLLDRVRIPQDGEWVYQ